MTSNRQTLHKRILETAMSLFLEKGIRAVRMDDIAGLLSISKRTLYEVFPNKEQLLLEGIKDSHDKKHKRLEQLMQSCDNVMDTLICMWRCQLEEMKSIKTNFISEITRYPLVMDYFKEQEKTSVNIARVFLKRGVDEGYFLKGLNYDLIMNILHEQRQYSMKSELYRQYSFESLFLNVSIISLRGFCTEKGIKMLDQFVQEELLHEHPQEA